MKLTLERQIPLAFIVALLLMVTISFFAYRSTTSLSEAIRWEKHTQEVLLELDETLNLTVDAETGARGFLITGEERFLEPYNQAQSNLDDNLKQLRALTIDNSVQTQKLDRIERLIRQRIE